jgi:hypothetical protein
MMKLLMAMVYVLVLHFYAISFDIWIIIDTNQSISHTPNHAYISKVGPFSIYSYWSVMIKVVLQTSNVRFIMKFLLNELAEYLIFL